MMDTNESGWIEWSGGECPVAEAATVKVQLREDRSREKIDADDTEVGVAGHIDWGHTGEEERWEVIAYRVVSA